MEGNVKIELTPEAEQLLRDMQTLPERSLAAIARAMDKQNQLTISHVIVNYVSFPKDGPAVEMGLRVQSGRYRDSIRASQSAISGQEVSSAIGSNVEYAAIHEFGGTVPAHKVTAKSGKALRFQIGDRVLFRQSVNIPDVAMPARRPIQHGIEDRTAAYSQSIGDAVQKAFESGRAQ